MLNHLAVIMDGNRRWAKERFLPAPFGHKAGAENVKKVVELSMKSGVKYLTLWGLSVDNLDKRPKIEVEAIVKLINNVESYLGDLVDRGIKFETIGNIDKLPLESRKALEKVKEKTKNNSVLTLTLALVYGGQDEIIRGIKKFVDDGGNIENLTTESFKGYLDTSGLPNPDVIVRTGGNIRHSGFLLYDSEYSEYYFTEKKWPEFDGKEFNKMLDFFDESKRNFGK